jgi:WD40 repeat protein
VGSNFGKMYRVIASNLDCTIHCEGHLQAIVGLSLPRTSNDIFVTIDMEGFILVWDLNDVLVITRCAPNSMNRVRGSSICLDDDKTVVSGWKDGFLRAFQITNKPVSPIKWELANGHKGSVTAIYAVNPYYIVG